MRQSSKKSTAKFLLILFLALVLALVLFRHTLFVFAAKVFLNGPLSKEGKVQYDTVSWQEDRLVITGFKLAREDAKLTVDRIEMQVENSFFPLYFESHLLLVHPELILQIDHLSSDPIPLGILFPTEHFALKLEMQNGVLELDSVEKKDRLYFSFKSDELKEKIGTFLLSYDPTLFDPALVSIGIEKRGEGLFLEGKIARVECIKLQPLFSFINPSLQKGIQKIDGEIEGLIKMKVSPSLSLEEIALNFEVKDLNFANSALGIKTKAKSGSAAFLIPSPENAQGPFWDTLIANASIREGELILSNPLVSHPIGLKDVSADLSLNPEEDPSFILKATIFDEISSFPLTLEGRGSVNEDATFWAEAGLQIDKSDLWISFCCPQTNSYMVHTEAKSLDCNLIHMAERASLVSFLKNNKLEISDGELEGTLSVWIENERIEKLSIDNFIAKDLLLKQDSLDCFFDILSAKAYFLPNLEKLALHHIEADFQGLKTKGLYGMNGHFCFLDQKILPSFLAGEFFGRKGKLIFYTPDEKNWDLLGSFSLFREEKTPLQIEFGCDVVLSTSHPKIGEGWFQMGSKYGVHVENLKVNVEAQECDFAICILEEGKEIARTQGIAQKNDEDNIHISLDTDSSHFFGVKPDHFELDLNEISQLQVQIKDMAADVRFVFEKDAIYIPSLKLSNDKAIAIGEALFYPDTLTAKADISHFIIDLSKVSDSLIGEGSGSAVLNVGLTQEKAWEAEGEADLQLKIASPVSMTVKSDSKIPISLNGTELKLGNFSLLLGDGTLSAPSSASFEEISYDFKSKEGVVPNASMNLSPQLIERIAKKYSLPSFLSSLKKEPLQMNFVCDFSQDHIALKSNLKDGKYWFGNKEWDFSQICLLYDSSIFTLTAKTRVALADLFLFCKMDFTSTPLGMIKLQENPKKEGLKILFLPSKEEISWESCQGSLYGLDVQLRKEASKKVKNTDVLVGNIKIDGKEIIALVPEELQERVKKWKVGSGYELEGSLNLKKEGPELLQFIGQLKGKDFSLFGYEFKALLSDAEITPSSITLKNLSCDDEAGHLQIKQIKLTKDIDQWTLDIPLVQAKDLRPSVMHKIDAENRPVKPLTIKNCTISGIKGVLGDLKTITGKGSLNFTNAYKKEYSLLDLPFEMLKDLGLDFNMLTPVIGEANFVISLEKCVLTDLQAFSESRRSQFFLHESEKSYLDFDGNLHLDLKLKQDVTLKIAEPFTLNVRGKLEKPKYMLR